MDNLPIKELQLIDIAMKEFALVQYGVSISDAVKSIVNSQGRDAVVVDEHNSKYYVLTAKKVANLLLASIQVDQKIKNSYLREIPQLQSSTPIKAVATQISIIDKHIAVVSNDELVGIAALSDIFSALDPMQTVRYKNMSQAMGVFKTGVAKEMDTIADVLHKMSGASDEVIILNEVKPVGIFTMRDFMKVVDKKINLFKPISEVMSRPVVTIHDKFSMLKAMQFIRTREFKRAVLIDSYGSLSGVIHQRDLMHIVYNAWGQSMRNRHNELKKNNKILQKMALTDALTGAGSRRKFNDVFATEISRFKRYGKNPLSLIMMDIDHFKKINDVNGHDVGDAVLVQFARIIEQYLRDSDLFARWGGEEFILLLPSTELEGATKTARKLKVSVEEALFQNSIHITSSFGVTQIREDDNPKDALVRVDKALYRAKKKGRNRVESS